MNSQRGLVSILNVHSCSVRHFTGRSQGCSPERLDEGVLLICDHASSTVSIFHCLPCLFLHSIQIHMRYLCNAPALLCPIHLLYLPLISELVSFMVICDPCITHWRHICISLPAMSLPALELHSHGFHVVFFFHRTA